jgi:putative DNA primase/helicase
MLRHRPVRLVRARRMIGIVSSAAMMLDPISDTGRPVIGKGVETTHGRLVSGEDVEPTLAARQLGLRPASALGSVGSIGRFPVINGVGYLAILWPGR